MRRSASLRLEQLEDRRLLTVFVPTTFGDGVGIGSLRDQVSAANADLGAATDTIKLKHGTYTLTLAGTLENANATGDLDITSTVHKLVIEGKGTHGHHATIIDASALGDRVFQIVNAGTQVEFRNLVILGGTAHDDGLAAGTTAEGGGVLNNGGNIVFKNVVFRDNQALGDNGTGNVAGVGNPGLGAQGGAIWTGGGGSVTLRHDTKLQDNQAIGGNGADGAVVALLGGAGGAGGSAQGGGIYADSGALMLDDAALRYNTAQGGTGGIGGSDTVTAGVTGGVGGVGGAGQGGGAYAAAATITTIHEAHLSHNTAQGGTGGAGGAATLLGGAGGVGGAGQGGGLFDAGMYALKCALLHGNQALGGGGGVGGEATDVAGTGGAGGAGGVGQGGGLYSSGAGTIVDAIFAHNLAQGGDGAAGGTGATPGAGGVGGDAAGGGGYVAAGTLDLKKVLIFHNKAVAGTGPGGDGTATDGGLFVDLGATVTQSHTKIFHNSP